MITNEKIGTINASLFRDIILSRKNPGNPANPCLPTGRLLIRGCNPIDPLNPGYG
jgi:hypothetical protein